MNDDECIALRNKIDDLADRLGTLDVVSEGSVSALVITATVDTYPTSASSFFAVHPLSIDGVEAEGEAASFTPDEDRTFYVYNVGSTVPPEGTKIIATSTGGRWTFRYDG